METPKYWQEEPGKIIDTGKNVLEYYPRAMKLSVAKPSWTNAMGEVKRGKTVVLDLAAVKNNPEAAAMFRRIAERMEAVSYTHLDVYKRQIHQRSFYPALYRCPCSA